MRKKCSNFELPAIVKSKYCTYGEQLANLYTNEVKHKNE